MVAPALVDHHGQLHRELDENSNSIEKEWSLAIRRWQKRTVAFRIEQPGPHHGICCPSRHLEKLVHILQSLHKYFVGLNGNSCQPNSRIFQINNDESD